MASCSCGVTRAAANGLEGVGRKMQRLADQERRLGDRVGGAVGEHEPGAAVNCVTA